MLTRNLWIKAKPKSSQTREVCSPIWRYRDIISVNTVAIDNLLRVRLLRF